MYWSFQNWKNDYHMMSKIIIRTWPSILRLTISALNLPVKYTSSKLGTFNHGGVDCGSDIIWNFDRNLFIIIGLPVCYRTYNFLFFISVCRILPAMLFITVEITGPFPSYYYFATLLVILQVRDNVGDRLPNVPPVSRILQQSNPIWLNVTENLHEIVRIVTEKSRCSAISLFYLKNLTPIRHWRMVLNGAPV